jgi:branched-chain amino acid transport system permease protein
MNGWWQTLTRWESLIAIALVLAPAVVSQTLASDIANLFIFALLALGLNVVVGYTGLLHLGIAAFFGIGAFITGILTVNTYPFQFGLFAALLCAAAGAGLCGALLAAPTLRLRGDYLALVTLGFGEVVKVTLRNLEEITAGTRTIGPLPVLRLPERLADALGQRDELAWHHLLFYYLALLILGGVILLLRYIERSPLGRAWVALREDELAAQCMGLNVARLKLAAFVLSSAIAGAAGCLYAVRLTNTSDPNAYDFNRSVIILCCLILGGLGSIRGALLGAFVLVGYETILAPALDRLLQQLGASERFYGLLELSRWNLMLFGLALILMMRFRPEGFVPSTRVKRELHELEAPPPSASES